MAQPKRQHRSYGVRVADEADAGPSVRGAPGLAVPHERVPLRELDGRARVRRVLLRAGEVREECLPGSRLLMASLTALETVRDSGPGYCLITSMPMVWSVVFCVEVGFLAGGMRAMSLRFSRDGRVHTLFARTAGVNVSRVPQVPVWTSGGYLGIWCAAGIALTHTPR